MPRCDRPALRSASCAGLALVLAAQLGLPARARAAPEAQDEAPATEGSPPVQHPGGDSSEPADADSSEPGDADSSEPAVEPRTGELPVEGEPPPEELPTGVAGEPLLDVEAPVEPPVAVPVEALEAQRPAPALDTDGELDLDTDEGFDDDFDPLRDSPEAMSARRLLGAGVGAMVTGALLVGGSVALATSDPCDPNAGNNCFVAARDRAAVTMGAPGGLLLIGGIAMTTIGALQERRIRASFALGPAGGGLVVRGRF